MDYSAIKANETITVFVNNEGIEEELQALVYENSGECLYVNYFIDTSKMYKGVPVYQLEEHRFRVDYESITEHYEDQEVFTLVKDDLYIKDDPDEELDSEIEDLSDSENDEYDSDVAEDGFTREDYPSDPQLERDWDNWRPQTVGQQIFKDAVDSLEARVRHAVEN